MRRAVALVYHFIVKAGPPVDKSQMGGIYAVVLTYNRKELLQECLTAIQAQTLGCETVIVIDNGSTDGTSELIQSEYPWVDLCQIRENTGAAGGFNIGMRVAVAAGADFAWVMDDDVIPEPGALAELVNGITFLREKGISPPYVISTAWTPGGELTNVPIFDRAPNPLNGGNWPKFLKQSLVPVSRATFVSILIPSETFQTHGFPIAAMFIWGEDSEFTMRVTRDNPGFICGRSDVAHVRAMSGKLEISSETAPHRLLWHKYMVRNYIYSLWRYRGTRAAATYVRKTIAEAIRLGCSGEFQKARIILSGAAAGLTFRPRGGTSLGDPLSDGIAYVSPSLRRRIGSDGQHAGRRAL